jgi:hypothetical protein
MSNDEFLGYSMRLLFKSADQFGSREVQFFENRYAKGIARIGKATNDNRFAAVVFASPDGTRQVGLQLKIPDESTNDLSTVLDPILGSFRFTADRVDDQEKVKALIREAGIRQREDSQRDTAERIGAETNRRPSAAGFRH